MIEKEVNPRFEDFIFDWNYKNYFLDVTFSGSKNIPKNNEPNANTIAIAIQITI